MIKTDIFDNAKGIKIYTLGNSRGMTASFIERGATLVSLCTPDKDGKIENVGFCIDTGHEMCYNFSRDLIGKYGEYLIATHLNDNMGITNPPEITFLDDAHLLPFDGIADWNGIADRLNKCGYDGMLTFELNAKGRKGECPNRIYDSLSFEEYVNEAYRRAVKFREIFFGGVK